MQYNSICLYQMRTYYFAIKVCILLLHKYNNIILLYIIMRVYGINYMGETVHMYYTLQMVRVMFTVLYVIINIIMRLG